MITANAFLKAKLITIVRNSNLHLSNKQCSKTFDRMGLIAVPLKSSHVPCYDNLLLRVLVLCSYNENHKEHTD